LVSNYSISSVAETFFVLYKDYDNIFTSEGTTLSSLDYLFLKYSLEEKENIGILLDEVSKQEKKGFCVYQDGNTTLLFFPLQPYSNAIQGVVCFVIPFSQVKNRIEELAGRIDGMVNIYYDNQFLYGVSNAEGAEQTDSEYLFFTQKLREISVHVQIDEKIFFSWENVFSYKKILIMIILILLFVMSVFVISWKNYVPIHNILEKHFVPEKQKSMRDWYCMTWNDIDKMIEMLLYEKKSSIGQLEMQMRILREQAVRLIVTGGYSANLQSRLALLNIRLDYPVFGIIESNLIRDSISDAEYEMLRESIEELSESDIQLYSYWNESGMLDILALAEEEYHFDEIVEMLGSLFETLGKSIELDIRIKCRDLESLHQLYRKNYQESTEKTQECSEETEGGKNIGKSQRTVKQVIEYINNNCCDYDLSLEKVAMEFKITTSYLCTILKQEIGMSYKEYLIKLRIHEASKLLREDDISVADICRRVGYVNVSYFIKLFQKHTGMTPTRYRTEYHEKK